MRVVCVIPARVGSTRLPEKPLQKLADEPLIRLVARRAVFLSGADLVLVATDDRRVVDAVATLPGVSGVLTSSFHRNGTERIAEVARSRDFTASLFLNFQGDEPFVPVEAIDGVRQLLEQDAELATASCPLVEGELHDPGTVKVLVKDGMARMFTRELPANSASEGWARHLGLYGYTRSALLDWASLRPTAREISERLEQLRPMEHGRAIHVASINKPAPPGIDTPDDLVAAEQYLETLLEKVGA